MNTVRNRNFVGHATLVRRVIVLVNGFMVTVCEDSECVLRACFEQSRFGSAGRSLARQHRHAVNLGHGIEMFLLQRTVATHAMSAATEMLLLLDARIGRGVGVALVALGLGVAFFLGMAFNATFAGNVRGSSLSEPSAVGTLGDWTALFVDVGQWSI